MPYENVYVEVTSVKKALAPIFFMAVLIASHQVLAQSNDVLNSEAGKAATEGYKYQQQQQQQQQMKTYQNQAGGYNPGMTTKQVAPNTYVAPTYNNGAAGGQVTRTFK